MNLGKTLVGGLLGAAVAIGIFTLLKTQMNLHATWFYVVIGLLTGLGVRQAHQSLAGNVSYARGALSGAIAAGAILLSEEVVRQVVSRGAEEVIAAVEKPAVVGDETTEEEGDADAGDAESLDVEQPPEIHPHDGLPGMVDGAKGAKPQTDDVWPFVFMAVGIFLAYELARGSAAPGEPEAAVEPPPTDDDGTEDAAEDAAEDQS